MQARCGRGWSHRTSTPACRSAVSYGVFVGKQTLGGRPLTVIQHGGTINGFSAGLWRMQDEDRVAIVPDNSMSHEVPSLNARLAAVLYGQGS